MLRYASSQRNRFTAIMLPERARLRVGFDSSRLQSFVFSETLIKPIQGGSERIFFLVLSKATIRGIRA
jgi:hypothetical protein